MSTLGYRPTNLSTHTKAVNARAWEARRLNEADAAAILDRFKAGDTAALAQVIEYRCVDFVCDRTDQHPDHSA